MCEIQIFGFGSFVKIKQKTFWVLTPLLDLCTWVVDSDENIGCMHVFHLKSYQNVIGVCVGCVGGWVGAT